GDGTLYYDKGGFVFWMLADRIGRDNALRGMHDFVSKYHNNPDHPVLYDLAEHMRGYAPDTTAYDEFVKQWMDTVVVLEFKVRDTKTIQAAGTGWTTTATVENVGTGRSTVDV